MCAKLQDSLAAVKSHYRVQSVAGVARDSAGTTVSVDDPTEKPKELAAEAERGRSARTPALAISGVALAILALFLAIGGIALAVYLLA